MACKTTVGSVAGIAIASSTAWFLSPANALVVHQGVNYALPTSGASVSQSLDLNADGTLDLDVVFQPSGGTGTGFAAFGNFVGALGLAQGSASTAAVALFQPTQVIAFGQSFVGASSALARVLSDFATKQYIGAKIGLPSGDVLAYFSLAYDSSLQMLHIGDLTYETQTGLDLTVVPEPTSLAAMALGAAGLLRRNRR